MIFVLEYIVYYEGGGVIGVFATEEDARKVFWEKVATDQVFGGDEVFISQREVGKIAGRYNDEYDRVAEFVEKGLDGTWEEVFDD